MINNMISLGSLIEKLAKGGDAFSIGSTDNFLITWREKFGADVKKKGVFHNALFFSTCLDNIRLNGMYDIPCLLVGGNEIKTNAAVKRFKTEKLSPGKLPFIMALSDDAYNQAKSFFPRAQCLILSGEDVREMLASDRSHDILKKYLLKQIPIRRLNPYNILQPVAQNMFYGRESEIERLEQEEQKSFAIVGPSRMGKSSLLKHYRNRLLRSKNPRAIFSHEIDYYECQDTSSDGVARFLAMKIKPSNRSDKITSNDILKFLKYQRASQGHPLELLLDEVDDVCETETFRLLGQAAKHGLCRLILCGRSVLPRMLLNAQSPLQSRMDFLMLRPLDKKAARKLLKEPLNDLGFSINQRKKVIKTILKLTGRMPHLIQFYGERLSNLAIEERKNQISIQDIETLKWDFETTQQFISPLRGLDNETLIIAKCLMENDCQNITIPEVQIMGTQQGIQLSFDRTVDICNDLVINNILTWKEGTYSISNQTILEYAERFGFFNNIVQKTSN